jgi:alkaline phosphatase
LPNTNFAKNVIVFIADGASHTVVTASRIYDGQQQGMIGEKNFLVQETFPNVARAKTYDANSQVADSASTATAWNAGVKTDSGVLGLTEEAIFANCASAEGKSVTTLLEFAESTGMSTGIVSTARITHCGTYAHTPSRDWESGSSLTEEAVATAVRILRPSSSGFLTVTDSR